MSAPNKVFKSRSCRSCRERHTKCDDREPACRQCVLNDLECVRRVDLRFRSFSRSASDGFPNDQTWLSPSSGLRYRDQTPKAGKRSKNSTQRKGSAPRKLNSIGQAQKRGSDDAPPSGCDPSLSRNDSADGTQAVSTGMHSQQRDSNVAVPRDFPGWHQEGSSAPLQISNAGGSEPFMSFTQREAELIRNFSENMAVWVDITDTQRHFEIEVPRRALRSPVLRFAIMAFSSRHLNRFGTDIAGEALRHHNQCLELLIPILSGQPDQMTDDILAAVGILRMDEEMEDFDNGCHLYGAIRILNQNPFLCSGGGLGEAAALLCLRQDMYISLIHQRPLKIQHGVFERSASLTREDDLGWTNRVIHLLAQILSVIYTESNSRIHELTMLHEKVEWWMQNKPASFQPIYRLPRDKLSNRRFPVLWMLSQFHVVGLQYYYLAKLVLATITDLYQGDRKHVIHASRDVARQIRAYLVAIIGLAISNPKAENALYMARHMLLVWGSVFTDPLDQAAIEEFLANMELRTGWSTGHLIAELRQQWSDSDDELEV